MTPKRPTSMNYAPKPNTRKPYKQRARRFHAQPAPYVLVARITPPALAYGVLEADGTVTFVINEMTPAPQTESEKPR